MGFDAKSLARRVRQLRGTLGLTQAELGERADLDSMYISQVERGVRTPTLRVLVRIAAALKVSLGELVSFGEGAKDDALTRELRDLIGRWDRRKRQVALKMLRALGEL